MKLPDTIELDSPPVFDLGDRVRVLKVIRNDGTFPGKTIGEKLAEENDIGYVIGVGTYLQRAYVYSVHFLESNQVVGCLSIELERAEDQAPLIADAEW